MFKQAHGCQGRRTFIRRSIVHHQDYSAVRILYYQHLLQELDKVAAVLPGRPDPGDSVLKPVVASDFLPMLLCLG